MGKTVASSNISVLDFSVLLDMSNAVPAISITNLSIMNTPANLSWAFVVLSPFGTPIHEGNITTPDIVAPAAFSTYIVSEPIPLIFGQLEFNASTGYSVKVIVKDLAGNVFDLTKSQPICKPNGNNGKNNFGAAIIEMETKCSKAQLYVVDKTNLLYKGILGTKVSTAVTVSYPKDINGISQADKVLNSLPALVALKSEGEGHNIYVVHKYDYNLGDNFFVRVRYSYSSTFAVWCSVNLCPLFCEVDKLTASIEKNCDLQSKSEQVAKLQIINAKMTKAVVGTLQPLCGFDVPGIIEEIKELGGFECDCCSVRGISDVSNVLLANANLSVNKVCGDMLLSWSVDVNGNIVLNYQDVSYVFQVSEDAADSDALTLRQQTVGCVKTTTFKLNKAALAIEIVNEIQNNQTLISILQSLLTSTGSQVCAGLNGYKIVTTGNYNLNVPGAPGLTIFQILITGQPYLAPVGLLLTNAAGIAGWLNGLGKGIFVVTYDATNNITSISSAANSNIITSVIVGVGQIQKVVLFSNSGALICNILQSILTYLNGINLLQVSAGGNITICKVVKGAKVETVYPSTTSANEIATKLAEATCIHSELLANGPIPLAIINSAAVYSNAPTESDVVLMIINGVLTKVPLSKLGVSMFSLLCSNAEVKSAYCSCASCTGVSTCAPVTGLSSSVSDVSATFTWNPVVGATSYKYSLDGITYISVLGTSKVLSPLTPGTSYVFRIYPVFATGDGTACEKTQQFTTTAAGVACAAPTGLAVNQITHNSARVAWAAVPGASGYQYNLLVGGVTSPWTNIGNVLETTLLGLVASSNYIVGIRAMIGGAACVQVSTAPFATSAVPAAGNLIVDNNSASATVSSVTPTGANISGAYPQAPAAANVVAFTSASSNLFGNFVINLTGSGAVISIMVNGVFKNSMAGTIGANALSANEPTYATDNITITISNNLTPLPPAASGASSPSIDDACKSRYTIQVSGIIGNSITVSATIDNGFAILDPALPATFTYAAPVPYTIDVLNAAGQVFSRVYLVVTDNVTGLFSNYTLQRNNNLANC